MTESEYLASEDPAAMLCVPTCTRTSDRKLRLLCWAIVGPAQADKWAIADYPDAPGLWLNGYLRGKHGQEGSQAEYARVAGLLHDIVGNPFRPPPSLPPWIGTAYPEFGARCNALFLAERAYEERLPDGTLDPLTLAAVADALEEAGCQDEEILHHLRGEFLCPACSAGEADERWYGGGGGWCAFCDRSGPQLNWMTADQAPGGHAERLRPRHVRGCWAVDAILGKE